MSLAAWAADVEGKTIGSGECVALDNDYAVRVIGSPPIPTTGDNYAITQFESFPTGGLDQWYSRVGPLGPFAAGDHIFWARGSAVAPVSHVAVVLADLGPVVSIMSQNTNGHRYAERTTLPRAGVAGALRPKSSTALDGGTGTGIRAGLPDWMGNPAVVNGITGGILAARPVVDLAATGGKIVAWLQDPENWKRVGIGLLGMILIMVALLKILNTTTLPAAAAGILKAKP